MSGKLAWSIGIALAILGLILFGVGHMMKNPDALDKATKGVTADPPSSATVDALAAARRAVAAQIEGRQQELISLVGTTDGARISREYAATDTSFPLQVWPTQKGELDRLLREVEVKRPLYSTMSGKQDPALLSGDPDRFEAIDTRIRTIEVFTRENSRLGRLAASCVRDFVMTARQAVAEVRASRGAGTPLPVFEVIRFDFDGEGAKFADNADQAIYGEQDPFIRRNFVVEFYSDPAIADRITRAYYNRELKPAYIRCAAVHMLPGEVPTRSRVDVTPEQIIAYLRAIPASRAEERLAAGMGTTSFGQLQAMDDAALKTWLAETRNIDQVRAAASRDSNSPFRDATPTRVRLTLQLVEPKQGAAVFSPLEKVSEGLPPVAAEGTASN